MPNAPRPGLYFMVSCCECGTELRVAQATAIRLGKTITCDPCRQASADEAAAALRAVDQRKRAMGLK